MAKASPFVRSFNAGEFSPLMEGRTDIDRYPSSMRAMLNSVAAPQGPALRRSGTEWKTAVYDEAKKSALVPFIFSEEQAFALEFADLTMRVQLEGGPLTYTAKSVTQVINAAPMRILVPSHAAVIGDQIALSGFPAEYNANNRVAKVVAVYGNELWFDFDYTGPTGYLSGPYAARLFRLTSPYAHTDVSKIRYIQSVDVLYLFCDGYRNYKLSRRDTYDWTLEIVLYNDGPYMPEDVSGTRLTLATTGNPIPDMTSPTAPYGTAFASGGLAYRAFDDDMSSYWDSSANQGGYLGYSFQSLTVVDGYVVYVPRTNNDSNYAAKDYAPSTWEFQGNLSSSNEATWETLDAQNGYLLYDEMRSVWFKINNKTAYRRYRLKVSACVRNGPINVRVARLVMSSPDVSDIVITASKITDINGGDGFKTTDIDRLIRIKGSTDATWRQLRITSRVSATIVNAKLLGEPFAETDVKTNWRLGYWSDTTGWPVCASWFEDRLALAGPSGTPDLIALSRSGAYEDFQSQTTTSVVLDDSAVAFRVNSRRLSRIRWLASDERGLLAGTGSQEFVVVPADSNAALTARNIRARASTERGSANVEPVRVDRQVLYTQASGKTIREYAYVFEADGYKSPSMSLFASHLGASKFTQMVFAAEPHSIVWMLRGDGTVVGLTYNRDENVVGWHRHDFAGGVVESMCVIPSLADGQDALWMVMSRTVDGEARRYIEKLTRFWDFDSSLDTAFFVDCGLRYQGEATDVLYGLWHLEGCTVDCLIDGIPVRDLTVADGAVQLPIPGANIAVGLHYETFGEISRLEAGAADGTSQGKTKRIHNVSFHLWQSAGGEFGAYDKEIDGYKFDAIEYPQRYDELEAAQLQTAIIGPLIMPTGYGKDGTIAFRQNEPLPFNLISIMPQLNTQDR